MPIFSHAAFAMLRTLVLASVPLAIALPGKIRAAPPQGTWVNLAADGRPLYARNSPGNRVPDFGDCGYKAGREAIPEAPVKAALNPAEATIAGRSKRRSTKWARCPRTRTVPVGRSF